MNSLILQTAARYLIPLLILFSIFALFRGHNLPGGGFAGGLLAATAFAIYVFAWDAAAARKALKVDPRALTAIGLATALGSGVLSILTGAPYLTGIWPGSDAFARAGLVVGTPIVFDIGVYLVVVGSALTIILSLTEEEEGD